VAIHIDGYTLVVLLPGGGGGPESESPHCAEIRLKHRGWLHARVASLLLFTHPNGFHDDHAFSGRACGAIGVGLSRVRHWGATQGGQGSHED